MQPTLLHLLSRSSLLLVALGSLACGPAVVEEEEVQRFERRRPTCELFCELLFVPDCGSIDPPYEGTDDCVQYCMSEEASIFRLQEDGTDACLDEVTELFTCAERSTCEEQWIIYNNPAQIYETRCVDELASISECERAHPE